MPQPGPGPAVTGSHQPDVERQQRGSPTLCGQQCLISRLKARQAQASPCYPLLVSPPHSGIPIPPAEITGERFPRFPRDTRCVAARDLQPCVTDSGLVQLHQHRENEALPVAHTQQALRQNAGTQPGSTEPEEGPGSGSQGGQRAPRTDRAVRNPSADGTWGHLSPTCPRQGPPSHPPGVPSREAEQRCPITRGRKARKAPHRDAPGPRHPTPARPRNRPGSAALGGARARGALVGTAWGLRDPGARLAAPQGAPVPPAESGGAEGPWCRPQGRGA